MALELKSLLLLSRGTGKNRRALKSRLPWQRGRLAMCNGSPFTLPLITSDWAPHTHLYLTHANTHTHIPFLSSLISGVAESNTGHTFTFTGDIIEKTDWIQQRAESSVLTAYLWSRKRLKHVIKMIPIWFHMFSSFNKPGHNGLTQCLLVGDVQCSVFDCFCSIDQKQSDNYLHHLQWDWPILKVNIKYW